MSKYDDLFEEMNEQEEQLLQDYYQKRMEHLDNEVKVRFSLPDNKGFRVIEPVHEYENTPEYIEHQKASLLLAVQEEKAKITAAMNTIKRKKLQRQEIKELREEK